MLKRCLSAYLLAACGSAAIASDLRLMTEEYPPYNFESGDRILGLGAEQVFEIMSRAGLTYDVEITRWSRAIGSARRKSATCVFSTFRTPDREGEFVWIGPLSEDRSLLIKRADRDIALQNLEDAQAYSVGTQTGEFTVGILEAAGFDNVEQAPSMADALKKLLAGRNDLMAVPELFYRRLLDEGVPVAAALTLPTLEVALACNPDTNPLHVAAMQTAMDSIIADGTQKAIIARHK